MPEPLAPAMNKSTCFLSSLAFGAVSVTDSGHSIRCEVVCPCSNLHFSNDVCKTSFHVLIYNLSIFVDEGSLKELALFLNLVSDLFIVEFLDFCVYFQ